jgi:hypothetical protein
MKVVLYLKYVGKMVGAGAGAGAEDGAAQKFTSSATLLTLLVPVPVVKFCI